MRKKRFQTKDNPDFVKPTKVDGEMLSSFMEHTRRVAPPAIMDRAKDIHSYGGFGNPVFSEDFSFVNSVFEGSFGETYEVSLNVLDGYSKSKCECAFFEKSPGVPCKHLVSLAIWAHGEGRSQVESRSLLPTPIASQRHAKSL